MRKLLVILFLLSAFLFYSYAGAGQEEEKGKVVVIDPDDTAMIHNWPLWLFNHGYTSYYDSNWMNNYRKGHGAIVIRKPLSFGEAFLDGLGKGLEKGIDNHYRAREQKQDIEFKMGLLKLKWASEGKSKFNSHENYRSYNHQKAREIYEAGKEANLRRIKELDRIIEQKKEEDDLTKYMRSIGATRPGDKKIEKPEDDIVKFARSQGAMLPREYKTKKLNEYLKSQGLSPVPTNVDVSRVFDGDWVIYWDGEKWARKKK